jgi:hypothetical protein
LFQGLLRDKGHWSLSFISLIVDLPLHTSQSSESCNPKTFVLILCKNITKNKNSLSWAIQNKKISPQRKIFNPIFSFLLKKIYIIKYGGNRDCMVVGCITTYAISAQSQLMLWVRIRLDKVYLIQHYVIMFLSDKLKFHEMLLRTLAHEHDVLRRLPI